MAAAFRTSERCLDWQSQRTLALKGLETAPHSMKTWANLAVELAAAGDLEGAVACCNRSLAIFSYSKSVLRNKSRYLIRLKRYPEAEACLKQLVKMDTEYAEDYNNLAWLMQLKGDFKKAAELLEHSLKMDPKQSYIRKGLERMKKERGIGN